MSAGPPSESLPSNGGVVFADCPRGLMHTKPALSLLSKEGWREEVSDRERKSRFSFMAAADYSGTVWERLDDVKHAARTT